MLKHIPMVQVVTESKRHSRACVRSLRAVTPDRALAQLIAMHDLFQRKG